MLSVATENPGKRYQQDEVVALFGVTDRKITKLFSSTHIASRYLSLGEPDENGLLAAESGLDLNRKHREQAVASGQAAIARALESAGLQASDIDYIACVTSTGFLCPGLSAHLIKAAGLRPDVHRLDVVGMGCNAGLNGMQPLVNFCRLHPGSRALLVCAEICSASYVFDMSMRTAVVNSLFGDGVAAAVFGYQEEPGERAAPEILGFTSHMMREHIDAMRFDYEEGKYSFYLDRDIPYVIGDNAERPIKALLNKFGLKLHDIKHWIVHSGGRKVIDAVKFNLGLSSHAVRHTEGVLKDLGNLSSGSFLFSHQRLIEEDVAQRGDYAVMMTMGPGATIECCLARF
ncbi:type III polyketide synthase [Massilia sp. MB5]|uniref:3,5-dihydroxyphenylacetyl-CoA synthase DpgA n=1 Tax=Massilia sp. MB5 TaxID=2919578 RepID=UPI001F0E45A3|nr:3,5-dihydroxyphenylacetyl-CoA synthase DpgA [Massilia sp. MB5]UMR32887.1 type III polyketide synthase [Massilia sp. MB5]